MQSTDEEAAEPACTCVCVYVCAFMCESMSPLLLQLFLVELLHFGLLDMDEVELSSVFNTPLYFTFLITSAAWSVSIFIRRRADHAVK